MKLGILSLAKKLSLSAASLAVLSTSSLLGLHSAAHAAPPPEAFIKNSGGSYYVVVSKLGETSGKPRALGLDEGVKPAYLKWVNDTQVFVVFWQSEIYQKVPIQSSFIYSVDTTTMKGKILIKPPRGLFRQYNSTVVDWLEDDPDNVLMAFDKNTNNDVPDIYRVNVKTGSTKQIKSGSRNVQHWITDNDGEPRIGRGRRDNKDATQVMKIRMLETDKWVDSDEFPGLDADADIYGFTDNPDEIIIGDYRGKDTLGLYVYDLESKSITLDEHATLMEKLRQEFENYNVSYVDESANGDAVLAKISSAMDPGYMVLYDKTLSKPKPLGAMYPGLESKDMGEVISVSYKARDGQRIPSYVTIPPTITTTAQLKGLPFIVLPHGGPYSRDAKRFDYFAQFFASRGYGVGRKNWVVMQEDVEDGTRWLFEKGYADPKRTCIAGWSYGGYAALMGAGKNPELYSCAISMAGVTDIRALISDASNYRFGKASVKKFVGAGFSDKDDMKANSPVKLAADMTVPLFLAHGERDQAVHFSQYSKMKNALKKSKAKVTYMKFEDEDHYLSNQDNRQQFFNGLDKFLTKVNGKSEFMAP